MMESSDFSFERFMSLSGSDLVIYAEPYVTTEAESIRKEIYSALASSLADMDETHLVYALEICMKLKPKELIQRATAFLAHPDAAVCSTAFRIVEYIPVNEIPTDVVDNFSSIKVVDLFGPNLRTGERICMGTNETLLRMLLEKLGTQKKSNQP
jgi:hypothetical protein